ncbi:MAG: DUF6129 family protein [Candidatus Thiodiazotropha lotti]|uniref:DUF6129 domain-containing protein n=1 Tax=Candidatus Thiodiazotropha endoloripes TaxID=1818881 RepID=A0A1E2UTI2_9GAMM|nr:DUF6129 family protein [Candidatus Thiodiazotropha endoloripes]MCG7900017.1 DUF6129 family protein [Candidatus Thiodiazotropha weberae]MCG7990697.1 DUF6129 family protein [Candidatus Thiodiazotropha lotti]MCG7901337.1 DUF6129 family protein [Candidatus Thiodiazotropha weberae]MCG7915787.1 DUF6129 family protein [Candidatus Thiodiazotropha weberae]MCG7999438.1 DUF6129 family protein [Candidatus Thiodiazotropha lotti]
MISQAQINDIGGLLKQQMIDESSVNELRQKFPDIHFTYCMDDDVIAALPLHEAETFNLYLIDSRNHCLCFTQDMEIATGIVVAEIEAA